MNEKIKAIANKAGCDYLYDYSEDGHAVVCNLSDIEKFAQLLIEECVTCVKYTDKDHIFTAHDAGVVGAAHDRAMKAIRKHFGVE
jgi:hypothetical protein